MKVLYSCLSQSWGGMEMYTLRAIAQLQKRGIETELLCFPNSKIHFEAEKSGLKMHLVKASGYFHPLAAIKLSRLVSTGKFDAIHTQASKDLWIIVPALKLAKSKLPLFLTKQVGSFIVKKDLLHKWIYKRVTKAFAISAVIKKNLLETCPLSEDKIIMLHNGVDTSVFNPDKVDPQKVRLELGIKKDEIVIGMLARFSWGKGHEEFLFAASKLISKFSNLKFLIVGEPSSGENEYADKIKKLADSYNLDNRLIFTGFRKDTPEVIAAMDIFAFPSHSEAFGIALVEAMAMGKASVCSNSDGILDISLEGKTCLLFQKQDGQDLADKLAELIVQPEKRAAFGIAGRDRAIKNFEIELLTDKVISYYQKEIDSKK